MFRQRFGRKKQDGITKIAVQPKGGKRPDLDNTYFRSKMEANYARYLNWLKKHGKIQEWRYEHPDDIWHFERISRGNTSYKTDFRIVENDGSIVYHEVKGWYNKDTTTKMKYMERYYPDVKIIIIDSKFMSRLRRNLTLPHWE